MPDPVQVDQGQYVNQSCQELAIQANAINEQIKPLLPQREELQGQRNAGVAVGIVLSPLAGAIMNSDANQKMTEVNARYLPLQGQYDAINAVGAQKGCWEAQEASE